jgi:hypothetical protein
LTGGPTRESVEGSIFAIDRTDKTKYGEIEDDQDIRSNGP